MTLTFPRFSLHIARAGCALLALGAAGAAAADTDDDLLQASKLHRIGATAESVAIWQRLASQGQVDAQYNLGVIYQHADGVEQNFGAALRWYTLAAEQGDSEAQQAIGSMYMRGLGVKRDERAGMRWIMLRTVVAHHEHMNVAEKWKGQIERAILQDERKRLEMLYVQSQVDGEATVADLRRRAGLGEVEPAQLAEVR
jgi:hypothetical protein